MNYYIDIKIKPDAEMRENVLLNKVFTKFHKALSDMKTTNIGVSFPRFHVKLGDLLRIHSDKANLELLQSRDWLGGLSGYCDISNISEIPGTVSYRNLSRKQTNMSPAKLRRLIRRCSITEDESKRYKAKMYTQSLEQPYVELESTSNGHKHRRFIEMSEILDTPVKGQFNKFGLSKTATVPWF